MTLFRPEVVEAQRKRLHGAVTIHQPPSLLVMAGASVLIGGVCFVAASVASVSSKETAQGWVVPTGGLTQVIAPRAGVVRGVTKHVGEDVEAGEALGTIGSELSSVQGAIIPLQRQSLRQRLAELDAQIAAENEKEDHEASRLSAHVASAASETEHLHAERALQGKQLELAQRQFDVIQPLVAKGFIATDERERRQQALFNAQQSLSAMTRTVEAKTAEMRDFAAQRDAIKQAKASALSQLRGSRASLVEELDKLSIEDAVVLRAPVGGRLAAVNVANGDAANTVTPAVIIAPRSTKMNVQLFVPTRSAGFLAPGESVRVTIDAYPVQKWGAIDGEVETVSRAPTTASALGMPFDIKDPGYSVVVRLPADEVTSSGRRGRLQPGMTVKATIIISKKPFWQSLFGLGSD